jgi:hypothetical protein
MEQVILRMQVDAKRLRENEYQNVGVHVSVSPECLLVFAYLFNAM